MRTTDLCEAYLTRKIERKCTELTITTASNSLRKPYNNKTVIFFTTRKSVVKPLVLVFRLRACSKIPYCKAANYERVIYTF